MEPEFAQLRDDPEIHRALPVLSALDALTEEEMVAILTETKNAMMKQYASFSRWRCSAKRDEGRFEVCGQVR